MARWWACYDPGPAPLRPRRPPPSAARPPPPWQSGRTAFQQRTLSTTLLQVEQSAVECAGPIDLPAATRGGATSLLSSTHGDHFYPLSLSLLLLLLLVLLLVLLLRTSFTITCLRL